MMGEAAWWNEGDASVRRRDYILLVVGEKGHNTMMMGEGAGAGALTSNGATTVPISSCPRSSAALAAKVLTA